MLPSAWVLLGHIDLSLHLVARLQILVVTPLFLPSSPLRTPSERLREEQARQTGAMLKAAGILRRWR